jgi:ribonucleotide monophosphatase NagD (HAD superfamily)
MYRRETLVKAQTKKKKKNEQNRKRNIIVNFRMSPEEKEELENRIKLSGMVKQNYMIKSSLHQQICVVGNQKVFEEIKKQVFEIQEEMRKAKSWEEVDLVKLESLRMIAEILEGIN